MITAVNGTPVTTTNEISDIKNALQVGDTIVLTVWRDRESMDISVVLVDTNKIYG